MSMPRANSRHRVPIPGFPVVSTPRETTASGHVPLLLRQPPGPRLLPAVRAIGVGVEGLVDDVGKPSLVEAQGFGGAVAGGTSAVEQLSGAGVVAGVGDGDPLERGVELSVANPAGVAFLVARPDP